MTGYIKEMRRLIGHSPIIMVGAGVLITNDSGCLLLLQRADNHFWGIPGGSMEPGERIEETALRETFEETGLVLEALTLHGVFSGPELFYTYPSGDQVYNVSVVYTSSVHHGELATLNNEHLGQRFFPPDAIQIDEISPPVRPVIESWLNAQQGVRNRAK